MSRASDAQTNLIESSPRQHCASCRRALAQIRRAALGHFSQISTNRRATKHPITQRGPIEAGPRPDHVRRCNVSTGSSWEFLWELDFCRQDSDQGGAYNKQSAFQDQRASLPTEQQQFAPSPLGLKSRPLLHLHARALLDQELKPCATYVQAPNPDLLPHTKCYIKSCSATRVSQLKRVASPLPTLLSKTTHKT